MQRYFKTGKTIVIDDQYNEAKPLLDALCRIQIPFLYTEGKPNSDFPLPSRESHYSLVFLDLNLDFKFAGGQIGTESEEKTFKSTHAQLLQTILENRNRSFILIIWSNEEEDYLRHFLKIFDPTDKYYSEKKPYKIISLSKPDFFKNVEGNYTFISGKEMELTGRIEKELEDLNAFKLFCEWDRVVAQSVGDAMDDFMGLVNHFDEEAHREDHLAKIITAISIAYSGEEGYLRLRSNEEKTDTVLLALTQILNDDVDRNVLTERQQEFDGWKASTKEEIKKVKSEVNKGLLNKKLLVFKPHRTDLTGSTYRIKKDKSSFESIFLDSFESSAISKEFIKQYKKEHAGVTDDFIEKIKKHYSLTILTKCTIPIELNITPLCDIVQNKLVVHRTIQGLLIPAECADKMKKSESFVSTPIFSVFEKDFFLGIDLRTLGSCTKDEILAKDYLFTLRTNLINDIQTKLAAHVSRLGVFNL